MKFVVSRGDTNNPRLLGIEIPPSTPGFKHPRSFPRGFRFEVVDPERIRLVKHGLFTIVDDGSPESVAAIAKIDAEIANEIAERKKTKEREERANKEPWTRAHKLQVISLGIAVVALLITSIFSATGWYRAVHQSPVYLHQIQVKHQAEVISKEIYEVADEFDSGDPNRKADLTGFYGNKLGYRIDEVVKELSGEGLHTNLLDQTTFGVGMIRDGNQLREYAAAITNLSAMLPNSR